MMGTYTFKCSVCEKREDRFIRSEERDVQFCEGDPDGWEHPRQPMDRIPSAAYGIVK